MVGKTWRSRGQIARTQTLGKVLAIGLVGLMACAAPVAAEDTGVASTEVPPVVTEAPVEPTEAPPPPTEAPLPTEIPAPTEAPVIPTEAPVEPTEAPSDPVGTPAEVATEAPTPTPTPAPAIPFAPEVDCQLIEGGALPVAGDITWSFQDCTVTWETENVSDVALHAWSEAAGWQVIAVTADELGYQDLLDASDGRLSLTDSTPDDDAFTSSRFYLGTQLGCTSPTEAAIALDLTATSTAPVAEDEAGNPLSDEPGETVVETAEVRSLVVDGTAAAAPNVTISSVSFSAVENSLNATSTGGSIELTYDDAPARCGWELVITFTDFTNGSQVIPAAGLTATGVTGLDGIGFSSSEGAISIVSPTRDRAMPTSGVIVISMELLLDGFVLGGDYGTTVVAQTIASP